MDRQSEEELLKSPETSAAALSCSTDDNLNTLPEVDERLELYELIGAGAFSHVYRGRHRLLDSEVAVKVFDLNQSDAELALKRFHNEAELLNSFNHKNIVKFFTYGKCTDGRPYMVLEFLSGKTLDQILEAIPLSAESVVSIFAQVCDGLAYAHEKGVVHRDIKPANIMLVGGGDTVVDGDKVLKAITDRNMPTVKILDFGIFRRENDQGGAAQQLTQIGALIGSSNYMSPEQCRGGTIDARSDIYSVGCVIYEALCGVPPMNADSDFSIMSNHLTCVLTKVPSKKNISREFEAIVLKCLKKEPAERYQSANELHQALESCNVDPPFRIPIKPIVVLGLAVIVSLALALQHNLEHQKELAEIKSASVQKTQLMPGRKYETLVTSNNPALDLQMYEDWLRANYKRLMSHYHNEKVAFGQIAGTYEHIALLRQQLKEPERGRKLAQEISDLVQFSIRRMEFGKRPDDELYPNYNGVGRGVYDYYFLLFALTASDGRLKDAEKILDEVNKKDYNTKQKNDFFIRAYQHMREVLTARGDYEECLKYQLLTESLMRRVNDPQGVVVTKNQRAFLLLCLGRRSECAVLLKEIEESFRKHQSELSPWPYATDPNILVPFSDMARRLGLQKLTISLLGNKFYESNAREHPLFIASILRLADAYLDEGLGAKAKETFELARHFALRKPDGAEKAELLAGADGGLLGCTFLQNDEDYSSKVIAMLKKDYPKINGVTMFTQFQNTVKSDPKTDRLYKKYFSVLEPIAQKFPLDSAIWHATRGHVLRGRPAQQDDAINEYERALSDFARYPEFFPGEIITFYAQALCHMNKKDLASAQVAIDRGYKRVTRAGRFTSEKTVLNLGQSDIYLQRDGAEASRKFLEKAIQELLTNIEEDRKANIAIEPWKNTSLICYYINILNTYIGVAGAKAVLNEQIETLKRLGFYDDARPADTQLIICRARFLRVAGDLCFRADDRKSSEVFYQSSRKLLTPSLTDVDPQAQDELRLLLLSIAQAKAAK